MTVSTANGQENDVVISFHGESFFQITFEHFSVAVHDVQLNEFYENRWNKMNEKEKFNEIN